MSSVSVGWVASEENWFKENVPVINFLKLRGSWGKVGNNNIGTMSDYFSMMSNIGEFHFRGHEFTIQTRNFTGEFKWSTDFNISFDRNKAIRLGTNNSPLGGYNNMKDYNRTAVGKQIGLFYGYVFDGVYMTREEYDSQPKHASSDVGTVRMKDLNNDKVIDNKDRTFIGNPNPDFLYGITNTFS